jgi:hypothetical protein
MAETIVLIRKHPNLSADISALHYPPLAVLQRPDPGARVRGGGQAPVRERLAVRDARRDRGRAQKQQSLHAGTALPRVPDDVIEQIIGRDSLVLLGLT